METEARSLQMFWLLIFKKAVGNTFLLSYCCSEGRHCTDQTHTMTGHT